MATRRIVAETKKKDVYDEVMQIVQWVMGSAAWFFIELAIFCALLDASFIFGRLVGQRSLSDINATMLINIYNAIGAGVGSSTEIALKLIVVWLIIIILRDKNVREFLNDSFMLIARMIRGGN